MIRILSRKRLLNSIAPSCSIREIHCLEVSHMDCDTQKHCWSRDIHPVLFNAFFVSEQYRTIELYGIWNRFTT